MQSHVLRYVLRAAKYLLMTGVTLYAADWAVFEVRQVRGTGLANVTVEEFLKTPLKGDKAEYDYLGDAGQTCSNSVFPQYASAAWNPPCWWLKRHNQRWQ